jgi:hypothetical protein
MYFFLLMRSEVNWLDNWIGVYFVNVSWLPIGQQCLIEFFCYEYLRLQPIAWRNLQNLRQWQRKTT